MNFETWLKQDQLKARLLSFIWRLGAYLVVAALAFIQQNLTDFEVSPTVIALLGLVCGEITKYLNNKYQLGRAVLDWVPKAKK